MTELADLATSYFLLSHKSRQIASYRYSFVTVEISFDLFDGGELTPTSHLRFGENITYNATAEVTSLMQYITLSPGLLIGGRRGKAWYQLFAYALNYPKTMSW